MHRINITIDDETYKTIRIQCVSEGLTYPGTIASLILKRHARNYQRENQDEIKDGFISGFLEGLDLPCATKKVSSRKKK